jgi:hypothetical protein
MGNAFLETFPGFPHYKRGGEARAVFSPHQPNTKRIRLAFGQKEEGDVGEYGARSPFPFSLAARKAKRGGNGTLFIPNY